MSQPSGPTSNNLLLSLPVFAKRVSAQGMAVHKMQRRPSSRIAVLYHQADTPHHVRTLEVQGVHQLHY